MTAPAFCGDAEPLATKWRMAGAAVGERLGRSPVRSSVAGTWGGTDAGIAEAVTGSNRRRQVLALQVAAWA